MLDSADKRQTNRVKQLANTRISSRMPGYSQPRHEGLRFPPHGKASTPSSFERFAIGSVCAIIYRFPAFYLWEIYKTALIDCSVKLDRDVTCLREKLSTTLLYARPRQPGRLVHCRRTDYRRRAACCPSPPLAIIFINLHTMPSWSRLPEHARRARRK